MLEIIRSKIIKNGLLFRSAVVLPMILAAVLTGCSGFSVTGNRAQSGDEKAVATSAPAAQTQETEIPALSLTRTPGKGPDEGSNTGAGTVDEKQDTVKKQEEIREDGIYHDLESVVLYYDKFGKLPKNFITKKEAKDLGWEGGELDPYQKGASIGGDYFGNYEKRLPADKGVKYIECDIDTDGGKRGAKRLIISSTGKYYYTKDHYETFEEVDIVDGKVVVK